jgi:hypothetical protein
MALVLLTKTVDQIAANEIVIRGESVVQVLWEDYPNDQASVVVRYASGAEVMVFIGARPRAADIHAKIREGM